ncbi:30S ribosomal protein S6 [Deferribacter abyssi]|uniref:30S ribosomal protein S6 n=1 Tax=Deferribacter abyssi TaxID=213806 RepID=UPI003C16D2F6
MRTYETLFIVKSDLSQEDAIEVFDSFKENITKNGGKIIHEEIWGKRTLAYKIEKYTEGYYFLINFEAEPTYPKELERRFKLNENVIRFIVVKIDGKKFKLKKQTLAKEETPKTEKQSDTEKTEG